MSSNKIMKKVTNLYEPLYGIPVPYSRISNNTIIDSNNKDEDE
ncbi:MAG: hypothetical protein ACHQ1D_02055 [Nitrososphaerales archaeon]